MIVRAFRLTDKLGTAWLKLFVWLSQRVLYYVDGVATEASFLVSIVVGVVLRLLGVLALLVVTVLRVFASLFGFLRRALPGAGVAVQQTATRITGAAAERRRLDRMARRAEELVETVVIAEDPLKVRNRTLSALLVVMMAVIGLLLIWATAPETTLPDAGAPPVFAALTTPETSPQQPTPFATAVPTVTPRPQTLRVGGSLVYTVRENGQDDLWVSVIGEEAPFRLTNHPADDRDPAWSPDGRQVAFASHRDSNWELYTYDVLTGQPRRITYSPGFEAAPSWSPDGQWLVYEAYQDNNLDIYIVNVGDEGGPPIRLTDHAEPDFAPVWSPGGREIAFVSWRDGNQDIYVLPLDDPSAAATRNLTNTPDLNENHPAWSPDGQTIAYSALADGIEVVYALPVGAAGSTPTVVDRGFMPAWSPDSDSLLYAVAHNEYTLLVAGRYGAVGVASQAVAVSAPVSDPDWTAQTGREFVQALSRGSGGAAAVEEGGLYTEAVEYVENAPHYRLVLLQDIEAPNPYLSDRVNDSFSALRQAVIAQSGVDLLGDLEDAFWSLDRAPEPGQAALNWHMTGRSFALNRNLIQGFPPTVEIVREDIGIHTYWRVYVRAAVQDGQLGEPLRDLPWDFMARTSGDVQAYEDGGRLRPAIPQGYYVDVTQLAADYGWERLSADRTWRANFGGVLYWQFAKPDGMTWQEAMLELYSAADLSLYLTDPTAFPTPTLAPPSPTPEPTETVPPAAPAESE